MFDSISSFYKHGAETNKEPPIVCINVTVLNLQLVATDSSDTQT